MANPSLNEFIAQSQRGLYQSVFGDQINKGAAYTGTNFTTSTAGDTTCLLYTSPSPRDRG